MGLHLLGHQAFPQVTPVMNAFAQENLCTVCPRHFCTSVRLARDKSAPRSTNFEFCFTLGRYVFANSFRGLMIHFVRRKRTRVSLQNSEVLRRTQCLILWKSRAVAGFGSAKLARLLSRGVESSGFKSERQWLRSARTRSASVVRQIAADRQVATDTPAMRIRIAKDRVRDCGFDTNTSIAHYSTSLLATLRSREHGAGSREKNTGGQELGIDYRPEKIRGTTILANWFSIKSGNCNGRKFVFIPLRAPFHFSFKPARVN